MSLTTLPDKSTFNETKTLEKIEELKHYLENCFCSEDFLLNIYQELKEKIDIITKIANQISSKKSFDIDTLQDKYNKTEYVKKNVCKLLISIKIFYQRILLKN